MTEEANGSRRRPDPIDAAAEIGAAGLRAASLVVEQMLDLSRRLGSQRLPISFLDADGPGQPGGGEAAGTEAPPDRNRDLRRLRADAERLIELYGDWTRTLLDGVVEVAAGSPGPDVIEIGPVPPGEIGEGRAFVQLLDELPAASVELFASPLVAHHRGAIPPAAISFEPRESGAGAETADVVELQVRVSVPMGTAPGTYHGHVLATGLPEVHLPLRVEVDG